MMDSEGTLWGEQRPGERAFQPAEETNLLIVHNGVPDWVRLPAQLGGQPVRVTGGERRPCPCGGTHQSLVLVLDEPTGICVAECQVRGFLWFRCEKK